MNAQPSFLGNWLVSEYVYTPCGEWVGLVRQRRSLQRQGEHIRVLQVCEPLETPPHLSPRAKETAEVINRRTGTFLFDLELNGQSRRYLGPDVLGGGFAWKEGVLTARGIWPRFGCNFTSYSFLLHPQRQLTGGKFFQANYEIATLVGVAVPETQEWPQLTAAPTVTGSGTQWTVSATGEMLTSTPLHSAELEQRKAQLTFQQQSYGALREIEAVSAPGETVSILEISDAESGAQAFLWKIFQGECLQRVEIGLLQADSDNARPKN
ncbi:MAG: hypothetical protein Fur0016_02910 [Anaerolineales bacterium]